MVKRIRTKKIIFYLKKGSILMALLLACEGCGDGEKGLNPGIQSPSSQQLAPDKGKQERPKPVIVNRTYSKVNQADPKESLRYLLFRMDAFGPTARRDYNDALKSFMSHDHALEMLIDNYWASNGDLKGSITQSKYVFLAGQFYNEQSVEFLLQVIFSKDNNDEDFYKSNQNENSDKSDTYNKLIQKEKEITKSIAASMLAKSYLKRVKNSADAIKQVFFLAEPNLIQNVLVDLPSSEITSNYKSILDKRGVFYDYRLLTKEETDRVLYIDPSTLEKHSNSAP